MIRRALLLAALALPAATAWADHTMSSGVTTISRSAADAGGGISASASNRLTGAAAEDVAIATSASASNRIRGGWGEIAFYPASLPSLTLQNDVTVSSATLSWTTPAGDVGVGLLPAGSAYLVQVASGGFTGIFADPVPAFVSISTSGRPIGEIVGGGVTGLDPNTTYYSQIWARDPDSNVSDFASPLSTITTLATAPTALALRFTSIQLSSVTVAWAALPNNVSSRSCEGYILQASSNNFGALAPTGAPVFSSATTDVRVSTLVVGVAGVPLELANTYYFQVASLNWTGQPNYTTLTRLNFQIRQSTGLLHLGAINPFVAVSTIATSSMNVVNIGNWPATIQLSAAMATTPSSAWTLSTGIGVDTAALQGVWYAGSVGPPPASFNTYITSDTRISKTGAGNNYVGTQNGVQVPAGSNITMWFRFFLPSSSATVGPETIQVTSQAVYP